MNKQARLISSTLRGLGLGAAVVALGLTTPAFAGGDKEGQTTRAEQGEQELDASGTLENIDRSEGTFVLDGDLYRAEPSALENLEVGQFVNVTIDEELGENFAREVQVAEKEDKAEKSEKTAESRDLEEGAEAYPDGEQAQQPQEQPQQQAQQQQPQEQQAQQQEREPAESHIGAAGLQASGTVDSVDLGAGHLLVDGRLYRAHPNELAGFEPGQQVNLTYDAIQGHAWISEMTQSEGSEKQPARQPEPQY